MQAEVNAAMEMLKDPEYVPRIQPGKRKSPWTLELSAAYWLLVLLGCRGGRFGALHPDDSEALHRLRVEFNGRQDLADLRAVAAGNMTTGEFREAHDMAIFKDAILPNLMGQIIEIADFLAMTPAQSTKKGYRTWVDRTAQAVLVDEAANMHRSDLACIWGNCLMPVFFGGDPRQLPPTVVTGSEEDSEGNLYHRLAEDGAISPLVFLLLSGLPVYRLRVQLRMADGLFDWVAEHLYKEVNFTYASSCSVDLPEFQAGRILERVMQKYPSIRPPPAGKMLPVFVHCEGAVVEIDERTGSKKCRGQAMIALDIAANLVKEGVSPAKISVLSPYAANGMLFLCIVHFSRCPGLHRSREYGHGTTSPYNSHTLQWKKRTNIVAVELVRQLRKLPQYRALLPMGEASTVDSFQGQENDIIIVIMGTSFPTPGPGFTTDSHRLNVLLTRQRCGLVVVGNVDLRGPGSNDGPGAGRGEAKGGWGGKGGKGGKGGGKGGKGGGGGGAGAGKSTKAPGFLVISPTGEKQWVGAPMLQHIHSRMLESGRVVRLNAGNR
jgi:hypothetical protein